MIWTLFISLAIIGNAVIDMLCLRWPLRVRQLAEGVGEAYLSQTVSVLSSLSLCQHEASSNFSPSVLAITSYIILNSFCFIHEFLPISGRVNQ